MSIVCVCVRVFLHVYVCVFSCVRAGCGRDVPGRLHPRVVLLRANSATRSCTTARMMGHAYANRATLARTVPFTVFRKNLSTISLRLPAALSAIVRTAGKECTATFTPVPTTPAPTASSQLMRKPLKSTRCTWNRLGPPPHLTGLPNGGCIWPWSCSPALFSASAPEDSTTTLDPWGPCVCVRLTPQILVLFLFGEWSRPHLYMVSGWSGL